MKLQFGDTEYVNESAIELIEKATEGWFFWRRRYSIKIWLRSGNRSTICWRYKSGRDVAFEKLIKEMS